VITPALLRAWGACWTDRRIATAFGRRSGVSPRDVAAAADVSLEHRLWVLCYAIAHLDEHAACMFAIESASLVTHLVSDADDQAIRAGLLNDLMMAENLPKVDRAEVRRKIAWEVHCGVLQDAASGYGREAAYEAAREAAICVVTEEVTWSAALQAALERALHWLGDYADGWEE
jgi:hypothetical protein